jgi:hydroxymethylbilane synthase
VARDIATLPRGAVVGSASLRRQAQIRRARPDVEITLLRGNVGTRLARTENGEIAATLLAVAGLKRLDLLDHATAILDPDEFLPAVGQGAIAIVTRAADDSVRRLVASVLDHATGVALTAERAFLAVLDGSCRTPIAGHARLVDGQVSFRGLVLRPDGSQSIDVARDGAVADAERIGDDAGREVKARMPAGMLTA